MTSEKQIEANRRNALKSTGPKTDEGKARASTNALRHGLTAEQALLPHEDEDGYEKLRDGLLESYAPQDAAETALVEELVNAYWRLLRLHRVETRYWENLGGSYNRADEGIAEALIHTPDRQTRNFFRYYAQIEKSSYRALAPANQTNRDRRDRKLLKAMAATAQNGFVSQNTVETETAAPNPREFPPTELSAPEPAANTVPQLSRETQILQAGLR